MRPRIVWLLLLIAPGLARADDPEGTRAQAASRAFGEGQQLFDNADYLGAIEAFKKAYQLRPHFLVMCNIALCHERKNDMIEAARHYQRCLKEGADKTDKASAVSNSLTRVEKRITWLRVSSDGGGTILVDGRTMGLAPRRIPLNPGSHAVEVRRDGAKNASTTISTRGGEELDVRLTPIPIAQERSVPPVTGKPARLRPHQAWFWTAAGLSLAFATAGTVTGVQTLQIRNDYEDDPTRELLDRGRSRRLVTNIMWAGAAVAAGSATALFVFTDFRSKRETPRGRVTMGLGLRGQF